MKTDGFRQYRRRKGNEVVAVRLDLDTAGFTYDKWGGEQRCKPGDWIVLNDGDTYTVDAGTFERTYEKVGPGLYLKITPVWAKQSVEAGTIATKEGSTAYERGDYIVANDPEGQDRYAISADKFTKLYEPAD
ncbi:MAG: hypothetical protein QNJ11_14040 [Woeseiaceae bacterium]|nr:hypothetical protein [Woeseiaceae bacterium]